jgi:hypothetical protein
MYTWTEKTELVFIIFLSRHFLTSNTFFTSYHCKPCLFVHWLEAFQNFHTFLGSSYCRFFYFGQYRGEMKNRFYRILSLYIYFITTRINLPYFFIWGRTPFDWPVRGRKYLVTRVPTSATGGKQESLNPWCWFALNKGILMFSMDCMNEKTVAD